MDLYRPPRVFDRDEVTQRLRACGIWKARRVVSRVLNALGDDAGRAWLVAFVKTIEALPRHDSTMYRVGNWAARHPAYFRFPGPTRDALQVWGEHVVFTEPGTRACAGWMLLLRWLRRRPQPRRAR
jgi:hypothetical protein